MFEFDIYIDSHLMITFRVPKTFSKRNSNTFCMIRSYLYIKRKSFFDV